MAISYPLPTPNAAFRGIRWARRTIVGSTSSPYTGHQQIYEWAGQWLEPTITLPSMSDEVSEVWAAWFAALNGLAGTFLLGPTVRTSPRGTVTGTLLTAIVAANATTIQYTGGTGLFAVGDWLQVGTAGNSRLHQVTQVNSSSSVDVFPRVRDGYALNTAITTTNPKGVFRLTAIPEVGYDEIKRCDGLSFTARESIT